ncbi:hypothetical protein [Mesorhizobium sp. M0088]|uniref:hypothetical protein n=1 Tax=Mesorhizobium sp. M0088 TaxID=2956873 RepID=UPI0033391B37
MKRSDFPEAVNGGFTPATTKIRCPKCKSKDISLSETMEAFTVWDVVSGRLNRAGGIHEFGSYINLNGQCSKCRHCWKVRGAIQITDAVTELDPKTFLPIDGGERP